VSIHNRQMSRPLRSRLILASWCLSSLTLFTRTRIFSFAS
jgi:hypothetical protein